MRRRVRPVIALFLSLVAIPVYVKHNISFREGSSQGRFELTLGPKQTMGKAVESVLVSSQLPRGVLNASLSPSQGTYTFDPVTKVKQALLCPVSITVLMFCYAVEKYDSSHFQVQFSIKINISYKQCRGKILLKVMRYNIALLPKIVTIRYLVTFYGK